MGQSLNGPLRHVLPPEVAPSPVAGAGVPLSWPQCSPSHQLFHPTAHNPSCPTAPPALLTFCPMSLHCSGFSIHHSTTSWPTSPVSSISHSSSTSSTSSWSPRVLCIPLSLCLLPVPPLFPPHPPFPVHLSPHPSRSWRRRMINPRGPRRPGGSPPPPNPGRGRVG